MTPIALALTVLLAFASGSSGARAQSAPATVLGRPNPLAALVPTRAQEQRALLARLEAELAHTLGLLPGVAVARVHIDRRDEAREPLDHPEVPPSASVLLQVRDNTPRDADVRRIVKGALHGLTDAGLSVVETAVIPEQKAKNALERVGPFRVEASSAKALRTVLALCLAANVLLATVLLFRARN